ncbi:MAG: MBL fold metallo-hydrolase [Candidatus Altiarchaeota archaeon]|nr:MBL fold metallo-hydrolase [Candidatus Altiarchaeota archaeon]
MEFHVLVEDRKKDERFGAEHGLSIYFEKDGKKILFDTGQSGLFLENAGKMGLDPGSLDYIVLSHGHYDHAGGLRFLPENLNATLVAHPSYAFPKYDRKRYVGAPAKKPQMREKLTVKPCKLAENVLFLGEIPGERRPYGESVVDGERTADMLLDDTALAIKEKDRLIILSGCAHSGVANITRHAKSLCPGDDITLIGGFHMASCSTKEIDDTIDALRKTGVSAAYPGHCTGEEASEKLVSAFGGERLYSGKTLKLRI